jgi:hypothetical protein
MAWPVHGLLGWILRQMAFLVCYDNIRLVEVIVKVAIAWEIESIYHYYRQTRQSSNDTITPLTRSQAIMTTTNDCKLTSYC